MHRGLYKTFDVKTGYIINRHTGENMGKHIDLYCYTADENNIYYETPHIDYPNNYIHIKPDGSQTCIIDYMRQNGDMDVPYVIISDHTKITSIEAFHIDECNRFYSVSTLPEIANFLLQIGLDKFFVRDQIWVYKLLELQAMSEDRSNFEILFFIDSADPGIRILLNNLRLKFLLKNLDTVLTTLFNTGSVYEITDNLETLTWAPEDKYCLSKAISTNESTFVNCGRQINASDTQMTNIQTKQQDYEEILVAYKEALSKFYTKLLSNSSVSLQELFDKFSDRCPFELGYTNKEIIKKVEALLC